MDEEACLLYQLVSLRAAIVCHTKTRTRDHIYHLNICNGLTRQMAVGASVMHTVARWTRSDCVINHLKLGKPTTRMTCRLSNSTHLSRQQNQLTSPSLHPSRSLNSPPTPPRMSDNSSPKKDAPPFTVTVPPARQTNRRPIRSSKPPVFVRRDYHGSNCTRGAAQWRKYTCKEHRGRGSLRSQRCTRANDFKPR